MNMDLLHSSGLTSVVSLSVRCAVDAFSASVCVCVCLCVCMFMCVCVCIWGGGFRSRINMDLLHSSGLTSVASLSVRCAIDDFRVRRVCVCVCI